MIISTDLFKRFRQHAVKRIAITALFSCPLLFATQAFAQWSPFSTVNTAISVAANDQAYATITGDGAGGAIITWHDSRNGLNNYDIYAQRIDAAGVVQWTPNGVPICKEASDQRNPRIASDGTGGAYIAWQDQRNGPSNSDIYAQHINGAGAALWTPDGIAICKALLPQQGPTITSDSTGGAVIAWEDARSGGIYAQRINSAGTILWGLDGMRASITTTNNQRPAIVSDGAGGSIITWIAGGTSIFAQRISGLGGRSWGQPGVRLTTLLLPDPQDPTITTDGAGGAIITWCDARFSFHAIFAQHLDGNGSIHPGWAPAGVAMTNVGTNDQFDPTIVSDGAGGAIITWHDDRVGLGFDIYAQRINGAGHVQWGTGGAAISTAALDQMHTSIVSDGAGGAIITWEDYGGGSASSDIYAQRIDSNGIPGWITGGVAISTATNAQLFREYPNQYRPTIVSNNEGCAIITWFDGRNGNSDIYAQQVSATGALGQPCLGCVAPPPDMVAWWPGNNNTDDITPTPDNGKLNGGATFYFAGEVAEAFILNGTTAYVSAPPAPKLNFGTGSFSIDAWIETKNSNGVQVIVDKRVGNDATTFTGYSLFTFNGNLGVQLADGTATNFISAADVADFRFHHVAVTVDRNSVTGVYMGMLYVDGKSVLNFDPRVRPGNLNNNAEFRIGRNSPNTLLDTFFEGLIDEVEVFNRALSEIEVQDIYNAGSRGKCGCTISSPANITQATNNPCGDIVTYPAPNAPDQCGGVTCSPPSGSFFPPGTTTVICSTTAGPSCTFTITLNAPPQPPLTIHCPANIVTTAASRFECVVVNFAASASRQCEAVFPLCSPRSGSCFLVGITPVTCTATDASGNTATCSFTVTVGFITIPTICLYDDGNPSIVFQADPATGAYSFSCGGTTFTGVAQVTSRGSITTFQQNGPDRRVTATIDGAAFKGWASLQSPPGTTIGTITNRDTRNNSCGSQ